MSFFIEALSSALGVPRTEVSDALDQLEARVSAMGTDLQRRAGAALGRNASSEEAADEMVAIAASVEDRSVKQLAGKLLLSAGGVAWGVGMFSAASTALAGGVALLPLATLVLAIVIIFVSGLCALGVLRELFSRLKHQTDQLSLD